MHAIQHTIIEVYECDVCLFFQESSLLAMSRGLEMKQISGADGDKAEDVQADIKAFVGRVFAQHDTDQNDNLSFAEFSRAVASYPALTEIAKSWVTETAAEFFNLSTSDDSDKKE